MEHLHHAADRSTLWIWLCSGESTLKAYIADGMCSTYIQLAPTGDNNQTVGGFPEIRWAQTANYGYVPNDRLKNVFMAVAIDLGDPQSPYGSIHPRDKQDVGFRLAQSARAVVYNDNNVINDFQGPIAQSAQLR